ncbi:hypothetical protein [Kitasatospora sp. NPDC002040]|uniref:hypothetical protein n=1 Tax=Kitasatospora sp. NPDC002040 TaxID=3154661 RepID=UPI0033274D90
MAQLSAKDRTVLVLRFWQAQLALAAVLLIGPAGLGRAASARRPHRCPEMTAIAVSPHRSR